MIILGLNHGELSSSAAIVKEGVLLAGSSEERFNRRKKTKDFPINAVQFCLKEAGIDLTKCDYVAQAWNPSASFENYNSLLSSFRARREDYFYTVPDNLYNLSQRTPQDWVLMNFPDGANMPPIYYVQHHRTHAANAFYLSPFEDAAIMTADFRGEFETGTMSIGRGTKIELLQSMRLPHAIGIFYATYTELLGYRRDNDEWKVMALSAYQLDCQEEYEKIKSTIRLTEEGFFELDLSYYQGGLINPAKLYTQKLLDLLGGREGFKGEEVDNWHIRIAKAMQLVAEDITFHMLRKLYELTKCKNLVVGGGFFENTVVNGKILANTPFENLYVPYAPTDAGNSIGAALYVAHHIHNEPRDFGFKTSYLGKSYQDDEIEAALKRRHIKYEKVTNRAAKIAELLANGEIVSVVNGRQEFGERALGNRSILADPRRAEMKDKVNSIIKYREGYRPFAPVTTLDKVSKYFEVTKDFTCFYMEKVAWVRPEFRDILPATTHFDGSGRIQTVTETSNKAFFDIIQEFEKLTGIAVVLNTSFNINGEPIVLSPDDAISTLYNSGLDHLFIESFYICK